MISIYSGNKSQIVKVIIAIILAIPIYIFEFFYINQQEFFNELMKSRDRLSLEPNKLNRLRSDTP